MKKTIRLTESDIRRMIMEAINELDWKTAVNAANISRNNTKSRLANTALRDIFHKPYYADKLISNDDRGIKKDGDDYDKETIRRMKQSHNLSKLADKAIRDKFGFQSYYDDLNGFGMEQPVLRDYLDPDTYTGLVSYSPKWDDKRVTYYKGGDTSDLSNMPQDFQDKANEINDFVKGKYKYEKGKGWTKDELDEAITRAIHKYLR